MAFKTFQTELDMVSEGVINTLNDPVYGPPLVDAIKAKMGTSLVSIGSIITDENFDDLVDAVFRYAASIGALDGTEAQPGAMPQYLVNKSPPVVWTPYTVLDFATLAQLRAGTTGNYVPTVEALSLAAVPVEVPYAASLIIDLEAGENFYCYLTGAMTIGLPKNLIGGKTGRIELITDGSYSITIAGTAGISPIGSPVFVSGFNARNVLEYFCPSDSAIEFRMLYTVGATSVTAPVITSVGTVTSAGTPGHVGDVHEVTGFAFTGFGATPTFQWLADGANISGATGATYTPVSGDASKALARKHTVTNSAGSVNATTPAIAMEGLTVTRKITYTGITGNQGYNEPIGVGTYEPGREVWLALWQTNAFGNVSLDGTLLTPIFSGNGGALNMNLYRSTTTASGNVNLNRVTLPANALAIVWTSVGYKSVPKEVKCGGIIGGDAAAVTSLSVNNPTNGAVFAGSRGYDKFNSPAAFVTNQSSAAGFCVISQALVPVANAAYAVAAGRISGATNYKGLLVCALDPI